MPGWHEFVVTGLLDEGDEALSEPEADWKASASSPLSRTPRMPAASAARNPTTARLTRGDGHVALLGVLHAQHQPDMEGQHHLTALEVRLFVEVGRVGDDPPAALRTVHVPDVMAYPPGPTISNVFSR